MGGINTGGQFQRPMMPTKIVAKKPVNPTATAQNAAQTSATGKLAPPPKQPVGNANLKMIQSDQMKADIKETLKGEPTEKSLDLPLLQQEIPETADLPENDSPPVSEPASSEPEVIEAEAPKEAEKTQEASEPEAATEVDREAVEVEETEASEESEKASDPSESVESEAPKVDDPQPEVQEKEDEPEQEQDKGKEKDPDRQQDQEREGGRGGQQQEQPEQGKQQEQPKEQPEQPNQEPEQNPEEPKEQTKDQAQDQPKDQGREQQQGGGQQGQQQGQPRQQNASPEAESSDSQSQEVGAVNSGRSHVAPTSTLKSSGAAGSLPEAPPLPSFMQASFGRPPVAKAPSGGITAEALQQGKENLARNSQNAILRLGDLDTTVIRSAQSLAAKKAGSVFDRNLPPGEKGTLTVVGHGSERLNAQGQSEYLIGGKTPQQLVGILKDAGVSKLDTLNLKSCHSTDFMKAVTVELKNAGIDVKHIEGFDTRIAIDESSGETLTETNGVNLDQVQGHSGSLNDVPTAVALIGQGNYAAARDIALAMVTHNQLGEATAITTALAGVNQWAAVQAVGTHAVAQGQVAFAQGLAQELVTHNQLGEATTITTALAGANQWAAVQAIGTHAVAQGQTVFSKEISQSLAASNRPVEAKAVIRACFQTEHVSHLPRARGAAQVLDAVQDKIYDSYLVLATTQQNHAQLGGHVAANTVTHGIIATHNGNAAAIRGQQGQISAAPAGLGYIWTANLATDLAQELTPMDNALTQYQNAINVQALAVVAAPAVAVGQIHGIFTVAKARGIPVQFTALELGQIQVYLANVDVGMPPAPMGAPTIRMSFSTYPESAMHILQAWTGHMDAAVIKNAGQVRGPAAPPQIAQPNILTVDRGGANARRAASLHGVASQGALGLDRDEYPFASTVEGGANAHIKYISAADNQHSGAWMGGQYQHLHLQDGDQFRMAVGI